MIVAFHQVLLQFAYIPNRQWVPWEHGDVFYLSILNTAPGPESVLTKLSWMNKWGPHGCRWFCPQQYLLLERPGRVCLIPVTLSCQFWRLPPAATSKCSRNRGKDSSDVFWCLVQTVFTNAPETQPLHCLWKDVRRSAYHLAEAGRQFSSQTPTEHLLSAEGDDKFQNTSLWQLFKCLKTIFLLPNDSCFLHLFSSARFPSSSFPMFLLHIVLKCRNEHTMQVVAWLKQRAGDHCCPLFWALHIHCS